MTSSLRTSTVALIAVILFAITACGQMGSLTLGGETTNDEEEQSDEENER